MQRTGVISSTIRSAGYDAGKKVLEIEFTTGAVYRYERVPKHIYTELLNAPSKGAYFNLNVRDRYSYKKLKG